jgi:hypothetical protein
MEGILKRHDNDEVRAVRSWTGSEWAVVWLRYPTSKMRCSVVAGAGKRPSPRNSRALSQP